MADVTVPIIPWEELTLTTKLGEGGFGIVYKGNWKYGGEVAIKQIKGVLGQDAEQEFKKEAGAMAKLNSPYIIRLFGICWEEEKYAMVMELMPNKSLYHLLHTNQELPWSLRYNIAQDIAYGLRLLHARNTLHRDLKSLNVLLDANLRAKLTDFGLAKVKTQSKTTSKAPGSSVGTIAWMAPELFGLKPKYSESSDIYAYGMTAWELSSRETPYQDVGDVSIIKDAVKSGERADIPSNCPETFSKLIKACWTQDHNRRPTIDIVITALEQIIAKETPNKSTTLTSSSTSTSATTYQDASLTSIGIVTQVPQPKSPAPRPPAGEKYIAKYAFTSTEPGMLLFKQGEIIDITSKTGEWWQGELNGKTGWVPPTYITVYTPTPKAPMPQPNTSTTVTPQYQATKAKPQINPSQLQAFLNHVVAGQQDEAEALLKQTPEFALGAGNVTDHAKRTFRNITGFQYAVWALDWHMWRMIRKYLPPEEARLQSEGFGTGSWVKEHGEHVTWKKLIDNYQTYIDKYNDWDSNQCSKYWVQEIGGAQLILPMHVLQEYCEPSRPFYPVPNFKADIVLVRKLPEWLKLEKIGVDYSLYRAGVRDVSSRYYGCSLLFIDQNALVVLSDIRTQQRGELVAELRSNNKPHPKYS